LNYYLCHVKDGIEDLNRLKIVLVRKKRTGEWLAELLEVNPTTISKWCTNTIQPDLHTLREIAVFLEVNVKSRYVGLSEFRKILKTKK
jgi:Helix-turn-helix.